MDKSVEYKCKETLQCGAVYHQCQVLFLAEQWRFLLCFPSTAPVLSSLIYTLMLGG